VGDQLVQRRPDFVYVGVSSNDGRSRLVAFAGEVAIKKGVNAAQLVRAMAKTLNGSGGGSARVGQGGGEVPKDTVSLRRFVLEQIKLAIRQDQA
jgi:alanyl-tRNA synthetase